MKEKIYLSDILDDVLGNFDLLKLITQEIDKEIIEDLIDWCYHNESAIKELTYLIEKET